MAQFPIVLAAGQRRAFTANTISRDPTWRRRDPNGTLGISPHEAERFGLADGAAARISTRRGTARATVEIDDRVQAATPPCPTGPASTGPPGTAPPNASASP
ncbi:molybdopterin dinucleotide binding domain-containing protein [Streptomyces avermitilis]|uniref:molybdopterin dinucleotide binding domain-containing protein n=1 Tax=Streptomyces avermitilis TaxID=33903 RepID=UPI0036CE7571